MMKIMKRILLLVYYCIYKVYCKFFSANPLLYTYKLPFAKKYFERRGYDPTKAYMDGMTNPDYGFATIFAGGLVASLLSLFFAGFSGFFCGILMINLDFKYQIFISFAILFLLCELFLWNNNKEIKKEFKKFDKMKKWKKYLWLLITLSFFVIAIVIWWKGMVFWDKSIGNY